MAHVAIGDYEQALQRVDAAVSARLAVDQTALSVLAANPWNDPELNSLEFRQLLENLWTD